jgi:hypothetical protein
MKRQKIIKLIEDFQKNLQNEIYELIEEECEYDDYEASRIHSLYLNYCTAGITANNFIKQLKAD